MGWKRFFGALTITTLVAACATVHPILPSVDDLAKISDDGALKTLGLVGTDLGYRVIDAETGDILSERRGDRPYPPASTAKVATAVAALGILGADYRFRTTVWAHGQLRDGTLRGDLILSGNGDPLLSIGDLRGLVVRLRDLGIDNFHGRFLFHSALPTFPVVAPAQPDNAPYNQGVSGLNIDFNRAFVMRPKDGHADVVLIPIDATGLTSPLEGSDIAAMELPVRDPAKLTARLFRALAKQEGLSLPNPQAGAIPRNAVPIAQIHGQPLIEVVRAVLQYSNNMVAEAIGLAAARASGANVSDLSQSALRLGLWLEREVTDLDRFAPNLTNHSGLSATSRITPAQMTRILHYAYGRRFDGWRLDTLMPPGGGRDGYDGRFRSPTTAHHVWAKSGNMHFIKGLSGYADAQSGRRLAFSVHAYDTSGRKMLSTEAQVIAGPTLTSAAQWRQKVGILEEALISRWISSY